MSVKASGMLSPSEQKSSSTANGTSSAQLGTNKKKPQNNLWSKSRPNDPKPDPIVLNFQQIAVGQLALSISLPVCVESFGDAASRDAEPQLRLAVRQSWVGRRSLHLCPAQLLQSLGAPSQQGRRDEVPQRGAATHKQICQVWPKRRGRTMERWEQTSTLAAAGRPAGRHGCWTGPRSWWSRWIWSTTQAAVWTS